MTDPNDLDRHDVVVDAVNNAVLPPPSGEEPLELLSQSLADPVGVLRERALAEGQDSPGDRLGEGIKVPESAGREQDAIGHV